MTDNPLLAPWSGPFSAPPFDRIRAEHFLAAFDQAIPEARAELGITEGMIRYSAGLEHAEDLIEDLYTALEQA